MEFLQKTSLITAIIACCLTTACSPSVEPPDSDIALLYGSTTATGTVVSTGASLYRRGTHVLQIDGKSRFYLESASLDLNQFIQQYAAVTGELTPNSHERFLPVIVVQSIQTTEKEKQLHAEKEYAILAFGITVHVPENWIFDKKEGDTTFRYPGEEGPFIRITLSDMENLPDGFYIRISGQDGVRVIDEESGVHTVFLKVDAGIISFTYAPKGEGSLTQRDAFYTMLRHLLLAQKTEPEQENEESSDNSSTPSIPCGGPAGVVCPEEMYCKVEDLATGIGRCKKL